MTAVALLPAAASAAEPGDFLLIRRDLLVQPVHVQEMTRSTILFRDARGEASVLGIDACLALLSEDAQPELSTPSLLALADGQRLPGRALSNESPTDGLFVWSHYWMGRLEVPLEEIRSVMFRQRAEPPPTGEGDAVRLANGDRLDGLVVALGDPVAIEVERAGEQTIIEVPLERVVAVSMVTPQRRPVGRRVWFADGTVADVDEIRLGADGFIQLGGRWFPSGAQSESISLADVAGVLFHPEAMIPLASVAPTRVEGPPTRYTIPRPRLRETASVLELAVIEFQGPQAAHYSVPPGCRRFAARAELPIGSRQWGDYELVVRSDGVEKLRRHLSASTPTADINVELDGTELTIEMLPGERGPIQDRLVLRRAMLLVEQE